ncbi:hypothetical protein N7931_13115 [Catenovulum sp. 2E275]|uniref:DUF5412 family protein n=1 Tax=Catenovulum sp. 2E275 TaxID=2980497 RepID=UPI0021CE8CF0|nr:hypothetical protein [Catenovulum sp. 2E275]MCU4676571.1 hypothetical protein [Catenovulum sp. 2E275]
MNLFIKIICWMGGIAALISAAFVAFMMYLFSDMCGNYEHSVFQSPDAKYKAVIFQRDCGATTGFSTQISILPSNEALMNESGNIFAMEGHSNDVAPKVEWLNDVTLKITSSSENTVYLSEASFGWFNKFSIVYE